MGHGRPLFLREKIMKMRIPDGDNIWDKSIDNREFKITMEGLSTLDLFKIV